ncbi:MAG: hypothetical protein IKV36_05505, partial [Clostridia bacterium]|nr:hypothetical protein [Clostridia bacterium]
TATDDGATINLKVTVDAEKATYYINGTVSYELFFTEAESVAPFAALTSRGANVEVSNVTLKGLGAKNCTHTYSNDCDTTCDNCGAIRTVGDHVYDNDYDADCNNCGATRTPPATALPTIGENTNFAGNLVFGNETVNAEYAENGTITTAGLNGQAAGVLLNENGAVYVKTDITFNGNVDYNWAGTTDEETGETTYSYKQAWGRTGVQIGTYYSTGRERRMSVFVTYRRCTGGVYVWDDSQEVNGNGNPVVVGNIANNKETLSFVVRYDSAANNVAVWADGAYVGTVSLEAFGEFEFALGVTQYGSGTTAVDPSDNTNGETTPNSVTFANFEVWGDLTETCVHEYDNACDADCNKCGETREVAGHNWADADCDTPKTCNTCGATEGEALGHNWADADCTTPATCTVCGATTGEALGHDWADADCDTPKTCNTCGATEGEALGHDWADADCTTPATCTVCGATNGEALGHDWADADCDTPKTCNTCGATEGEALGHVYDDEYDADCNVCGATREVANKVVIGDVEIDILPDEKLPVNKRVDTKYVLGWKNPDGSTYVGDTYVPGLVAEFVETKMMTVKYQLGRNENSIRYIASVDETERYAKVGWCFSLTNDNPEIGGIGVVEKNSVKVYSKLLAEGVELTTDDVYGEEYSKYFYVFEITDIPAAKADTPIYVKPYVEMNDGTIVYGDVSNLTLNQLKDMQ